MKRHEWAGLDIGGANLKVFWRGEARSVPFQLWRHPERLAEALRDLDRQLSLGHRIAVTMTGELCDCFESRAAGVRSIVQSVEDAFADRILRFYQTTGELVAAEQAVATWMLTAASNWHASATIVGLEMERRNTRPWSGMLIDIGSTTTDLIPVVESKVAAFGKTDFERLFHRELVYTGIERSPVSMVAQSIHWQGRAIPLAQEWFASMQDVWMVLGRIAERPGDSSTADGRPADREHSRRRLARMLCTDIRELGEEFPGEIARQVARQQFESVASALLERVGTTGEASNSCVVTGVGEWLATEIVQEFFPGAEIFRLSEWLSPSASAGAAAWAVAKVAEVRC